MMSSDVWKSFTEALDRYVKQLGDFTHATAATTNDNQTCTVDLNYLDKNNFPHIATLHFHHKGSRVECFPQLLNDEPLFTMTIDERNSTIRCEGEDDTPESTAEKIVRDVSEKLRAGKNVY